MTVGIDFDQLVEVAFVKFLQCKIILFSPSHNLWWEVTMYGPLKK